MMKTAEKYKTISPDTRISSILKMDDGAIDVLVSVSKHFRKLRNPFLRKALAPRVTVAQAAGIGKVSVDDFLGKLEAAGFPVNYSGKGQEDVAYHPIPEDIFQHLSQEQLVAVDVRPDIEAGRDPFNRIMHAVDTVPVQGFLLVINSFEPWPLIKVMTKKGWLTKIIRDHEAVMTYFQRSVSAAGSNLSLPDNGEVLDEDEFDRIVNSFGDRIQTIDVRGLEMPQPMVTILGQLTHLPEGHALFIHHQRIPKFLLPQLDEKGYQYCFKQAEGEEVKMLIYTKCNTS